MRQKGPGESASLKRMRMTKKGPEQSAKKEQKMLKKKKKYKMTKNCVYSRAYHKICKQTGLREEARRAGNCAVVKAFGSA